VTVPVTGTAGSGSSANIPTGRVALRVINVLKGNTLLLKYPGGTLRTSLPRPLTSSSLVPGQTLEGSIRRTSAGKSILTFRLPPEPGLSAMLKGAGIPHDNLSSVIARAFFRTGIKLSPDIIRRGRELIAGDKKKEAYKARLFSLLTDKGIDVSTEALSLLSSLGERHSDNPQDGQNSGTSSNHSGPAGDLLFNEFLTAVKEAVSRMDSSGNHPLQLFNHLKGKSGKQQGKHWVLVPFSLNTPHGRCDGRITFMINPETGEVGKTGIEAGFTDDRRWIFTAAVERGKKKIKIVPPVHLSTSETSRLKEDFLKIMSAESDFPGKIDPENDDIIIEGRYGLSDPFPASITEINEDGLNTTV
jgi:hypothetical protein